MVAERVLQFLEQVSGFNSEVSYLYNTGVILTNNLQTRKKNIWEKIETIRKNAVSLTVYSFASLAAVGNHCRARELSRALLVEELTPV